MRNGIIVGIGEALWDVLPEGKKLGGAPANFAYHVSQFGLEGVAVSAIGKDGLGAEIMENFAEKDLRTLMAEVPYETGTVQVTLDEKGIPQYEIKEGVAWDNIPYTPELEALARQAQAVCFGSLAQRNNVSRESIRKFITAMPEGEDVLKIFDINLRQHFYSEALLRESLELCNILKINDEELEIVGKMFGMEDMGPEERCRAIVKEYALKMLILTCGTDGSYVFTPEEESFQPTPKVEVADTVGAGDSFTGSFVASILKGRTVKEAHRTAVEVSAFVCTQVGAMPALPADFLA